MVILKNMTRISKIILLWLLALVVPIQGYAATTMLLCNAMHDQATLSANAHATAQESVPACHHDDGVSTTTHGDKKPVSGKHVDTKCSACASCCVSVTLLPATLDLNPLRPAPVIVSTAPIAFFTGFIPSGIERPPRNILV